MPRRAYSTLRSAPSHANSRASVRGPTASCIPYVPNTAPSVVGGLRDARRHRQARALSRATAKVVTRPIVGTLDTRHTPHKPKPEKNEAKRHFGGFRERDGAKPRRPECRVPTQWGPQCRPPGDGDVEANRRGARPSRGVRKYRPGVRNDMESHTFLCKFLGWF